MSNSGPYQSIEVTALSLEEAIVQGLAQLGLKRNEVIIEIADEGSQGVLGMGQRNAVIRLTPLREPRGPLVAPQEPVETAAPEPVQETSQPAAPLAEEEPQQEYEEVYDDEYSEDISSSTYDETDYEDSESDGEDVSEIDLAQDTLTELLSHLGIDADVKRHRNRRDGPNAPWILDVRGQNLGLLIGRKGETLDALQYITRLIVSREIQERANIVVDVEGYKRRRESALENLARSKAAQAKKMGRTITLEPMPPNERRIIHMTLRDDSSVNTESVGMGDRRRVTITPTE